MTSELSHIFPQICERKELFVRVKSYTMNRTIKWTKRFECKKEKRIQIFISEKRRKIRTKRRMPHRHLWGISCPFIVTQKTRFAGKFIVTSLPNNNKPRSRQSYTNLHKLVKSLFQSLSQISTTNSHVSNSRLIIPTSMERVRYIERETFKFSW